MKHIAQLVMIFGRFSCIDLSTGPKPPDIQGSWLYLTDTLTSTTTPTKCVLVGALSFQQNRTALVGTMSGHTATCGALSANRDGGITDGSIDLNGDMRFNVSNILYRHDGAFIADGELRGSVTFVQNLDTTTTINHAFMGTWTATR